MKVLKVLFAIFLFIIFILSIIHLILLSESSYGAYTLVLGTFISFSAYFAVSFLNLEIGGKLLSLKKQVQSLGKSQKELSKIVTALYKLSRINVALKDIKGSSTRIAKLHLEIREEIEEFLNKEELESFNNLLSDIMKNPN